MYIGLTYVDGMRADSRLNDAGEIDGLMADRVLSAMETAHLHSDAEGALSQVKS